MNNQERDTLFWTIRTLAHDAIKRNQRFIKRELNLGKVPKNILLDPVNIKFPPVISLDSYFAPVLLKNGEIGIESVENEWIWFFCEKDAADSVAKHRKEWNFYLKAKEYADE